MTDHWLHHRLMRERSVTPRYSLETLNQALEYGKSLVIARTRDIGHFDDDGNFIPCDEPQEFKDFSEVKIMDKPTKWQRFVDAWARLGR